MATTDEQIALALTTMRAMGRAYGILDGLELCRKVLNDLEHMDAELAPELNAMRESLRQAVEGAERLVGFVTARLDVALESG